MSEQAKNRRNKQAYDYDPSDVAPTDIAVVGMAGRFPGARTVAHYWKNLLGGVESVVTLSRDELIASGESLRAMSLPNYMPRWAGLADIEKFDAAFFGLSKLEGDVMDPQHRQFLETCVEALEDAGVVPSKFEGNIGVYAASGFNAYFPMHVLTHKQLLEDVGFFLLRHTGNDKDFLATRVAYCLGLRGPAINVQTACSSSLVAIHLAAQSLISRECDAVIAGGVTIDFPIRRGYLFRDGEILAPDGHCRAFDADAQGTVFGSGSGAVVLRRLEDALAEGDTIYAVVKGSAINNDGNSKVGYLAPSVDGQARCVTEALAIAGVSAEEVGYVECHGTGTPVGDPIEVQALTDAFRQTAKKRAYCGISSVKPNIGHLDTAAGVASFIKAVKSVETGELAPTLHFKKPNPRIDFAATPFFVVDQRRAWPLAGQRVATVNSLGVGGTNAHVVLSQPPLRTPPARYVRRFSPLVWSAKTAKSADAYATRLAQGEASINDAAKTLLLGRERYAQRRALAAASLAELPEQQKRTVAVTADGVQRQLVFVFSGGGAAHPNMGRDLYENEPIYRAALDEHLAAISMPLREHVRAALLPSADALAQAKEAMERPSIQLPAQVATQLAMVKWLASMGVSPKVTIGHSLGEYSAAYLAGVFDLASLMRIVMARGELFETVPEGAMLSVALDEVSLRKHLKGPFAALDIAAQNAPQSTVAAGPRALIDELEAALRAEEIDCRRLHIRVAAHSSMLEAILPAFAQRLSDVKFNPPQANRPNFFSNLTGQLADAAVAKAEYWVKHLRSTVRFDAGLRALLEASSSLLIDLGPGHGLAGVLRARASESNSIVLTAMRHANDAVEDDRAAVQLVANLLAHDAVDVTPFAASFDGHRVSMPAYAFDHQHHWLEARNHESTTEEAVDPLLAQPIDRWFWKPVFRPRETYSENITSVWIVGADAEHLARSFELLGTRVERFAATLADEKRCLFQISEGALPDVIVLMTHAESLIATAHFESSLALVKALLERDAEVPPRLVWITGDATRGDAVDALPVANAALALIAGVALVAPKEIANLYTRWLDVSGPTDVELVVQAISAAAVLPDERWRVSREGVFERLVERVTLPPVLAPPVNADDVVVVWGGTSGIGLEVAFAHAAKKARVIVVSRREPSREVAARISAAKQQSLRIEAQTADVSVREDVARVLADAGKQGTVRWVYLAAGVLDDQPLGAKDAAARARVLAPKQLGLAWHQELLPDSAKLVAFSSTSTHLAPAGQVDYVAANAVLDAGACDRIRVINWGMWRDVGMARRALGSGDTSAHPFAPDMPRSMTRRLSAADWVLDEHRLVDGTAVVPGTAYLESLRVLMLGRVDGFEPFALRDLELQEALVHQPGKALSFSLEAQRDRLRVFSSGQGREATHVIALRDEPGERPQKFILKDATALPATFTASTTTPWRQQPHALSFGPRWHVVKEAGLALDHGWARLELDERFVADLPLVATHPAILDLATAFALTLVSEANRDLVYVPVRYGRYVQFAPFEQKMFSFVRLKSRESGGRVVFDVTMTNAEGEVIAQAFDFTMRAVSAAALIRAENQTPPASLLELGALRGITTADGLTALWTALASPHAQLYVSSLDLEALSQNLRPKIEKQKIVATASASGVPRDEVERQLVAMFEGLLGASPVSRDDDFFALGGHSLLAVRLFNRIKKQFGVELGLSVLFEAPTVATLGTLVRGGPPPDSVVPSHAPSALAAPGIATVASKEHKYISIVPIQRGNATRRAFFCVHGAGGNVLNFRDLVSHIDPAQPFFGLQARGVDGVLAPHSSLVAMARDYLQEIRMVQPEGPYILGGYSGGGVVAYEMAKQLAQVGERVSKLVLLDTFVPGLSPQRTPLRERAQRLIEEGVPYIRKAAEWAVERRLKERIERRKLQEALARGGTVPFELRDLWLTLNFQRVGAEYPMTPYRGPAVLFRAAKIDPYFAYVGERLGWERWLTDGLDLVVVPGDHDSLVLEPHVFELGLQLDRILEGAK